MTTVFVDVGGTLWSERHWTGPALAERRRERLLAAGVPAERLGDLCASLEAAAATAEGEVPYIDVQALLAECLAAAGLQGFETEKVRAAWSVPATGLVPVLPGAAEFLRSLRSGGLRCFLLSNAFVRTAADYRLDFAAAGLLPLIDGIISSVDTLWRKPDPRIFEAALKEAGIGPVEAVMVGNSETKDVAPAKRLGLRTVRVCLEEPLDRSSAADAVCDSLVHAAQAVLASLAYG